MAAKNGPHPEKAARQYSLKRTLRAGLIAGALAFGLDLLIYAVAYFALGVPMAIPMTPGSDAMIRPPVWELAVVTFLPAHLAALLLAALQRLTGRGLVFFQLFCAMFLLFSLSAPLSLPKDVTTMGTRLTLALMQITTAVVILVVLLKTDSG